MKGSEGAKALCEVGSTHSGEMDELMLRCLAVRGLRRSATMAAMEKLPEFELFPDPMREGFFESTDKACGVCKRSRGMLYTGPRSVINPIDGMRRYRSSDRVFDGEFTIAICPWCIADGSARAVGTEFTQTWNMNDEDRELVEGRTPSYFALQQTSWLTCCDRACIYLGKARPEDLRGRWSSVIPSMLERDGYPSAHCDWILGELMSEEAWGYVFQCRVCSKLKGYWDMT